LGWHAFKEGSYLGDLHTAFPSRVSRKLRISSRETSVLLILGDLFKRALFLAHDRLLLQFPNTILFMIPTPIREGDVATPSKINPCRLLKLFRGRMSSEFVGD